MSLPHIPMETVAQRNLVFAYCAVWILQFGYGIRLLVQWLRTARELDRE